ncbi:MAG TPA: hypothetical protein V6C69_13685 [Trichormus sp.]|jgi:hypothetical protein
MTYARPISDGNGDNNTVPLESTNNNLSSQVAGYSSSERAAAFSSMSPSGGEQHLPNLDVGNYQDGSDLIATPGTSGAAGGNPTQNQFGGGGENQWQSRSGGGGENQWQSRPGGGGENQWQSRPGGGGDENQWQSRSGGGGENQWQSRSGGGGENQWQSQSGGGGDEYGHQRWEPTPRPHPPEPGPNPPEPGPNPPEPTPQPTAEQQQINQGVTQIDNAVQTGSIATGYNDMNQLLTQWKSQEPNDASSMESQLMTQLANTSTSDGMSGNDVIKDLGVNEVAALFPLFSSGGQVTAASLIADSELNTDPANKALVGGAAQWMEQAGMTSGVSNSVFFDGDIANGAQNQQQYQNYLNQPTTGTAAALE